MAPWTTWNENEWLRALMDDMAVAVFLALQPVIVKYSKSIQTVFTNSDSD